MVNRTFADVQRPLAVLLTLGALSACSDSATTPAESEPRASLSGGSEVHDVARPGEALFRELAAEETSFAGYFFEGGRLIVATADLAAADRLKNLVHQRLLAVGAIPSAASESLVVEPRKVEFGFWTLKSWRDLASEVVWGVDGVHGLDLDERRNRVTVLVESEAAGRQVLSELEDAGVPLAAVHIEHSSQGRPSGSLPAPAPFDPTTILGKQRPVVGGYKIEFKTQLLQPLPGCTLGFNARRYSVNVFLTASHCTEHVYQLDGSAAYQNEQESGSNFIGYEYMDPNDFDCDWWPFSPPCRKTDVALFSYAGGVSFAFGQIARTQGRQHSYLGSKVIDQANPRFDVAGELSYPSVGMEVNKLGLGTGWTFGDVDITCAEKALADENNDTYKVTCGYRADYYAADGDSGGPVFTWSGGSTIVATGIHFASQGNFLGWFSPMGVVEQEFGPLVFYDAPPPPLTATIGGPNEVPEDAWCTWQGFGSGGSGTYTFSWSGVLSGSGSTISGTVGSAGTLYLTVYDGSDYAYANMYVSVDQYAEECLE